MADVEEPQYTTLAERIAALNQQKNFQTPPATAGRRAPPPPPPPGGSGTHGQRHPPPLPTANGAPLRSPTVPVRPSAREDAPALPRRTTIATDDHVQPSPPLPSRKLVPPLPTRPSTQQVSPVLPPRRPSTQHSSGRRNSNDSEISYISTMSGLSPSLNHMSSATSLGSGDGQPARKLPPVLDQAKLPPLPPTRRELEAKAKEEATAQAKNAIVSRVSAPTVPRVLEPPSRPSLPPRLPTRPGRSPALEPAEEATPSLPARRLPPPPTSYTRPARSAFGKPTPDGAPPPIPLASRPTAAQIELASRVAPPPPPGSDCMICRDFSGPDGVGAQYPIASLPRHDTVGYLAHHLCSPFASPTDKARAIFVWCHHNIEYDVDGFFGGCIPRGQTVEQSIFSGKAVCEGYAKIYHAIAIAAGLECHVVGGHGKGFGHAPLKAGERPPPPNPTGHAWNAVRIDGGHMQLIDPCWGAGNVCDKRAQRYEKKFAPMHFIASNEDFGRRHFPEDSRHFYRKDGRPLPWEEYIVEEMAEEPVVVYGNAEAEGICKKTVSPRAKKISVHSGQIVRFQFGKLCEHWTLEKHGGGKLPYLFMMKIHGVDGRKEDYVTMEYDGSYWWYVDIPARDLGAPGQEVSCYAWDVFNGRSARGMTAKQWHTKGCGSWSWAGIACWQLV